ncbi:uncharacterized protein LOC143026948 [Oratosquilla oratoria]|uniref:uncharacterized protein LOC143026948 n=1 Tax=Oratosquilla oratoria TaxID=337810 RepID=UPI003F76794D
MIHGPCKGFDETNVCCQGKSGSGADKCGKGFPKPCRSDLLFGNNGYPLYRRRAVGEGGHFFKKRIKGKTITVDNAHFNVECSNSIKCIAYVTRYVNKGCDRILYSKMAEGDIVDEVKNYQEACYVNANEATWKIFKFPIHKRFPAVVSLDLHIEGENEVFYTAKQSEDEIKKKISNETQLTAFFKLCAQNKFVAGLFYHEMPNYFIFDKFTGRWVERRNNTSSLGRIRAVTSKTVELFYMRLLLTHRRGPTSFSDLRTVDGELYSTYREAVKAMGLLNGEDTWRQTTLEIINHTNDRKQLRATYASMLVFSDLEDQTNIWEETKDLFASDFLHNSGLEEYSDEIYLDALDDIQENVWNCGGGQISQYGLPPSRNREKVINAIRREKSYNKARLAEEINEKNVLLNEKQRLCYDTVMNYIDGDKKEFNGFFLDAPGGTGKSSVLNMILDTVRSTG